MSQTDMVVSNDTGANVRADINNHLAALISNSSGATEPATTYAFQYWADTTTGILKQRNEANTAWISLFNMAAGKWLGDLTGIDDNATSTAVTIDSNGNILFYEDTGTTAKFFWDASAESLGIGTSSPEEKLHIVNDQGAEIKLEANYSGSVNAVIGLLTAPDANRYVLGMYGKVDGTGGECNVANIRFWTEQATPTTTDSPGYITFNTTRDGSGSSTEAARIDSSGNLDMTGGGSIYADVGGIYLGGTGAANKLDDYEEGTWTPVATTANADMSGVVYLSQIGRYIKIGKQVIVECYIRFDAITSAGTGIPRITGLPFAPVGNTLNGPSVGYWDAFATKPSGYTSTGSTAGTNTYVEFPNAVWYTGTYKPYITFSLCYETA